MEHVDVNKSNGARHALRALKVDGIWKIENNIREDPHGKEQVLEIPS